MKATFKIENQVIAVDLDNINAEQITIRSIPFEYRVHFIPNLNQLKEVLGRFRAGSDKHFIFTDDAVCKLYKASLFEGHELFPFTAIEENKAFPAVFSLLDQLQRKDITKKEMFVSAGGGITQDVSAFVKAVYKRGIQWTYIPTTLLAMADSCIGAKACLNYGGIKNQLGLFSAPKEIYICSELLNTLGNRDLLSGYGEIAKLAIVGGSAAIDTFSQLTRNQNGDLRKNIDRIIKLALVVKKSVIELDEFENNIRKALNYGHTIGHAIEPIVEYKIPHGIAISIGMVIENLLSAKYGSLSEHDAQVLNNFIKPFIDEESRSLLKRIDMAQLISNMRKDKKTMNDDIYISVPFRLGQFDMLKVTVNANFEKFLSQSIKSLAS